MTNIVYRVSLDVHDISSQISLPIKKGDSKRKIIATLTEGGKPYTLTGDCTAVFTAKKPDGKILYNACAIVGNTIQYEITAQTAAVAGTLPCEFRVYDAENAQITCPRFTIEVDPTVYSDGEVVETSKNEVTELTELVSKTNALLTAIQSNIVSISVTENESGHTVTITDTNGTKSFDVKDGVKGDKGDPGEDGEDGQDGVSVTHSWDGTVLTVTSASGTSSADLKGDTGVPGADGHTPVKGVDYYTAEEKAELLAEVDESVEAKIGRAEALVSLPFTWVEGKYVTIDGARCDYSGCSIAYVADMTPYVGKTIRIKTYAFGDMAYLLSDASWARLLGEASNATSDNGDWEIEFTVPETAKYLQVSYSNRKNTVFQLCEVTDRTEPLWEVVSDLEKAVHGEAAENPLAVIRNDAGLLSIFRTVGCIGDSLASGCCVYKDANGTERGVDLYEFSWGQFLARMTGNTYYNFSRGGWSTKDWHTGDLGGTLAFDGNHACDAYIIGLGQNDLNQGLEVGTRSDIDLANVANNADTFYGRYAKIIQKIQVRYPKAKIFVCTDPLDKDVSPENNGYNAAIREIATMFSNVYLLDLYRYGKDLYDYNGTNLLSVNKRYAHFNAVGYYECAKIIATYVDWFIKKNPTEFLEVEFINTDYSYYG